MRLRKFLHPAHLLFVGIVAAGFFNPDAAQTFLEKLKDGFSMYFSWGILLGCFFFFCISMYFAFSRFGHLTLGTPGEKPEFSMRSWLAMLFAAGMGSGLVFNGPAEPLYHFMSPPPGIAENASESLRARQAMTVTFFHWGLHAWAIYAIAALVVAYHSFRRHKPMLPSTPMLPTHIESKGRLMLTRFWAESVNTLAVIAVVFGLVASLGQGVTQIRSGLALFNITWESPVTGNLLILATIGIAFMLSACTGIGKGIKILSNINMVAAIGLLAFVMFDGPTLFIIESFTTAIGDYLHQFTQLSFNLRQYSDNRGWTRDWTITYFLWWVAWAPFVGIFIARISRGRTVREFVLGVVLAPTVFSFLWFAAFGSTAIHMQLSGLESLGTAALTDPPSVTFTMLSLMPFEEITRVLLLFLIFIFLVTSADSGVFVLGMFTSRGNEHPPISQRVFWGIIMMLVAAYALYTDKGIFFLRAFAVVGAIPYLFVMLIQSFQIIKQLRRDSPQLILHQ